MTSEVYSPKNSLRFLCSCSYPQTREKSRGPKSRAQVPLQLHIQTRSQRAHNPWVQLNLNTKICGKHLYEITCVWGWGGCWGKRRNVKNILNTFFLCSTFQSPLTNKLSGSIVLPLLPKLDFFRKKRKKTWGYIWQTLHFLKGECLMRNILM